MRKLELLRKKVTEEIEKQTQDAIKEINGGEYQDGYIKRYLTDLRIKQLENGKITKEKAIELATKKIHREDAKRLENLIAKIEEAENMEEDDNDNYISIKVEWHKSRTWGYNPEASVFTYGSGTQTGTASGCGYDKESAAVAEALNKIPQLRKALYIAKNEAMKKDYNISNHDAIHYGAGYFVLPYFEGAVGMYSIECVLNKLGYKTIAQAHGKTFDYYEFKKES